MQRLYSAPKGKSPVVRLVLGLQIALLALAVFLGTGQVQAQAELPQQPYLPLDLALQAANAALAQCQADGYRVSVAVVERSGALKLLLRDDGASTVSISSGTRKAYTSANFGRSTQELAMAVAETPALEGLRQIDPQVLILGGGLPIVVNDVVVGGIGVGGAPAGNLDEVCAQAGVDAILAALGGTTDGGEPAGEATPTLAAEEEGTATPEPEAEATATSTP
jgi:uncharacterized protein GlcG (DUF336 family)